MTSRPPTTEIRTVLRTILSAGVLAVLLLACAGTAAGATWVVDDDGGADFTSIQAAVDAAGEGDAIEVRGGTYVENVNVNKRLTLIGDGAEVVTVRAASVNPQSLHDHVFEVTADYVNISGFTAEGGGVFYGARMAGVCLFKANFCNVFNNNVSNNADGISLYDSNNNALTNNIASNNVGFGIHLDHSGNNTIAKNTVSNTGCGVSLYYSGNNMITNNNASLNHGPGIALESSSNNMLTKNTANSNSYRGIVMYSSNNNTIYHNNLIDNTNYNAYDDSGTNQWDSGTVGNYYEDDYTGTDSDGDGIGDVPYLIPGGSSVDRYPLMAPYTLSNQPLTCTIELQKNEIPIDGINVKEFFDIYVRDSTDDYGIKEVRFSSDDSQDGNPTGEWTDWYDWSTSSEEWDAANKIKAWSFTTSGDKEVWAEIKDDDGEANQCRANIFAHPGYAIIIAGQGGWREKWGLDHSANNAYRVLRNLGFDDDHIFYLNSNRPHDVDGDGDDEVDAHALLSNFENVINEVKDKMGADPIPLILYLTGHGVRDPDCFVFDEDNTEDGYLWVSKLQEMLGEFPSETCRLVFINSCYSGTFITSDEGISVPNRIVITGAHDDNKRIAINAVRSSDRFWGNLNKGSNVKDAFTANTWPGEWWHLWLDDNGDRIGNPPNDVGGDGNVAAATQIGIPDTENLELTPWYYVGLRSPGELSVYDSQNRVTGLVDGEVKEEIPSSIYDRESKIVAIFPPSDTYRHEIVGTDEGTYGLDIASIEDGTATTFTATDIPISPNAMHRYTIDWDTLFQDIEGVTVQIDSDGDGVFERTIIADDELTADEFGEAPPSAASTSATGAPIDTYRIDEDVYAAGSGFATGTNVDICVVQDRDWDNGDQIPADVTGSVETVSVVNGDVCPVPLWHAPLVIGEYDIVIDANRNGVYDASTDGLDSGSPGFVVIDIPCCPPVPVGPDTTAAVPTISPIGAIILVGLLGIIAMGRIRRRFN